MRANLLELEAHGGSGMLGGIHGDGEVLGQDFGLFEAFLADEVEDANGLAALVAEDVFTPRDLSATIGAEKVVRIRRKVPQSEFVVVHGEEFGGEVFVVGLTLAGDIACAPAAVNEFPFTVIDSNGIPRMIRVLRRDRGSRWEGSETKAFAMASDYDAFQPCLSS